MHCFELNIKEAVESRGLLRKDEPVVAALSGGADSIALLLALHTLGYQCVAAHCNFHLRGEESDRDEKFAAAFARSLGIEIRIRNFDVLAYEKEHGVSTEMACRELRYEWFERLREEVAAQAIAVAHHRDDNIETMFLNLLRGTGIAGLVAMNYRNGYIVRPMLDISRNDVELYLKDKRVDYVTDSTNKLNEFKRNRLRNVILPMLREYFPDADTTISHTIANLRENAVIYNRAIEIDASVYRETGGINIARMAETYPAPGTLLFEMLHPLGFTKTQVNNILSSVEKSGLTFLSPRYVASLNRGKLIVNKLAEAQDEVVHEVDIAPGRYSFPVNMSVETLTPSSFSPGRDNNAIYLDADVLNGNPRFTLRHWRKGDRISPYGMVGTKKLSDIFSDAKLAISEKNSVWLLTRDDVILWVVGLRASRHFAVTDKTKNIIKLSVSL